MHFLRLLLCLICLGNAEAATRQTYYCDNGNQLDISFSEDAEGRPLATLHFADGDTVLPGIPAASGARYRAQPITLSTQGEEAILEDDRGNSRHCRQGSAPQPAPAAAAASSSFIDIGGQVRYLVRSALPPNARLHIRILDLSKGKRPLAELRYELQGTQVPIPFSTSIDRDLLGPRSRLAATAEITLNGRPLFKSDKPLALARDEHNDLILKPVRH